MTKQIRTGRWLLLSSLVCVALAAHGVQFVAAQDAPPPDAATIDVGGAPPDAIADTPPTPPDGVSASVDGVPPPIPPAEAPPNPPDDAINEDTDESSVTWIIQPWGCSGRNVLELATLAGLPALKEAKYQIKASSEIIDPYDYDGCTFGRCDNDNLYCNDGRVIMSLPQDEQLFLLAGLTDGSADTCKKALADNFNPKTKDIQNFGRPGIRLDYSLAINGARNYTVCSDTEWKEGIETRGNLSTFIFFINPCSELEAKVSLNITLVNDSSVAEYCQKLTTLTSGEPMAYIIQLSLYVLAFTTFLLMVCFCFRWPICCGLTSHCGLGWVTMASENIRLYSNGLDRGLIFAPVVTAMLTAYAFTFQPVTDKKDVLNYEYEGSVEERFKGKPEKGLFVWLSTLAIALLNACSMFGLLLLAYSHPRNDPSFAAKKRVALCCLAIFDAIVLAFIIDTWHYVNEWDNPLTSVWTQVPLVIGFFLSNIFVIRFLVSVHTDDSGPWDNKEEERGVPRARKLKRPGAKASLWQKLKKLAKKVASFPAKVVRYLGAAYTAVSEDATFKYSPFMLAALLMAFLLHTSNFTLAIKFVTNTASCFASCKDLDTCKDTNACFHKIQDIISDRVLGYRGVYIDTFKRLVNTVGDMQNVQTSDPNIQKIQDRVKNWQDKLWDLTAKFENNKGLSWIKHTPTAVRRGGLLGYSLVYIFGLYTIYYCARSYKRVFYMLRNAKAGLTSETELSRGDRAMINDIDTHLVIIEGAAFTGMLTSTCFLQLWIIGTPFALVLSAVFHQDFWTTLWRLKGPSSFIYAAIVVIIVKKLANYFLKTVPTDGQSIKRPIMYLVCFTAFSAVWLLLGFYLAISRLIVLIVASIFSFGRLDRNVYKFANAIDQGYGAFLAITTMNDAIDAYLEEVDQPEILSQGVGRVEEGRAGQPSPTYQLPGPPLTTVIARPEQT